jgi:hypothetical protein
MVILFFLCFSVVPKAHVIVQEQPNGEYKRKSWEGWGVGRILGNNIFLVS